MRRESKSFLIDLLNEPSPSNFEAGAQRRWRRYVEPHADRVEVDVYGNHTAILDGTEDVSVMIGGHSRTRSDFLSNAIALPWVNREERELRRRAMAVLDFLDLAPIAETAVSTLSFGTLKRVELGRALLCEPRLLLLDEPAGGLNHEEVERLSELIRTIRNERGLTVLLVEHHMDLVMSVSDKVVVLDFGRTIAQGPPSKIRKDPEVIRAYLGTGS